MTFQEYVVGAYAYYRQNPEQRIGQAFFNFLRANRPDLAKQISGTDPFYNDDKFDEYLDSLAQAW